MTVASTPYVHAIFIKTTPQRLWQALTDPEFTADYYFGSLVKSDWKPGSPIVYLDQGGTELIAGDVVEAVPGKRLSMRIRYLFDPKAATEPRCRLVYEIEEVGDGTCRLVVTQDESAEDSETRRQSAYGIPLIVSGLKTLLETGAPLARV